MGELTAIGFTPGQSLFHRLDPRTKQALLMGFSVMSLWGGLVFLASSSAVTMVSISVAGIRFTRMIRELRYFLVLLFFVFTARTVTVVPTAGSLPSPRIWSGSRRWCAGACCWWC